MADKGLQTEPIEKPAPDATGKAGPETDKPLNPKKPQRCFILGRARSGTTVFRSMLNTHPRLGARSEILNSDAKHNFHDFLARKYAKDPLLCYPKHCVALYLEYLDEVCAPFADKAAVLLDIKYECLHVVYRAWHAEPQMPPVLEEVRSNGWLLIHVTRRNHLRRMLSNKRAVESGAYHVSADKQGTKAGPVKLPAKQLVVRFDAFQVAYERTEEYFKNYPGYTSLDYDDMFLKEGSTTRFRPELLERMAQFLGVPNKFQDKPREGKVTPQPLCEAIANYAQVERALRGTPYERCLDENN